MKAITVCQHLQVRLFFVPRLRAAIALPHPFWFKASTVFKPAFADSCLQGERFV